ncbi:MAG: hypothetical protein IT307_18195 [Chloroflexi bacterium]|nr:hypothetical protein [Chloroflexota bacterium]
MRAPVLRAMGAMYAAVVVVGAIGGILGFAVQASIGQQGWWLVGAAIGMNAGAFWAAERRAGGQPLIPGRRGAA